MDFDSLNFSMNNNINKVDHSSFETKSTVSTAVKTAEVKSADKQEVKSDTKKINGDLAEYYSKELLETDKYKEKLSKVIENANEQLKQKMVNKYFEYRVHDATNRIIVEIKDSETGDVIKEIPPEKDLDMLAKLRELAGILVDEKR